MSIPRQDVPPADVSRCLQSGYPAPRLGLVCGSGFSGIAALVEHGNEVGYAELASAPRIDAVAGHMGRLLIGAASGVPCAVFRGRIHGYQGVDAWDAAWTARMAAALGCEVLILTNAAGAIREDLAPGELLLVEDHLNLTGQSPLTGWTGPEGGQPFVSMHDAYDVELRELALRVAAEQGILLAAGVYAGVPGPQYETPAEIAALRLLGADVVGMSTVHETITARALGVRVLGLSLVTNKAGASGLSHDEVLEVGDRAERMLETLLSSIIQRL